MLNIEVIKFEAQDVITASGVVKKEPVIAVMGPCKVTGGEHPSSTVTVTPEGFKMVCTECGMEVVGDTIVGGK